VARISVNRAALLLAAPAAVVLIVLLALGARGWIGQTFPGFFVLPNRITASVGLPGWTANRDGTIYQAAVVAVNGEPVTSSADVYRVVAKQPAGTPFTYTFRSRTMTTTLTIPSATFSPVDYWAIFGGYLATGIGYLLLGFVGVWLLEGEPLGRALLVLGGAGSLYALSAVDLYGPASTLRVNALTEPLFAAAQLEVALRVSRRRASFIAPVVSGAWWLAVSLAAASELLLAQPGTYSPLHAAAEGLLGTAGLVTIGVLLVDRPDAHDCWRAAAKTGALLGLGLPTLAMVVSSLSGGQLPINLCTLTTSLFPVCFGWGLVRDRLAPRAFAVEPVTI
jgi:hypothetical protein